MNILDFDITVSLNDLGELDQVLISFGEESQLLRREEVFAHARNNDLLCGIIVKRLADLKLSGRMRIEKHGRPMINITASNAVDQIRKNREMNELLARMETSGEKIYEEEKGE